MKTQNFDKLPRDAKLLIALFFEAPQSMPCYMVEVNISDPVKHLYCGGEGLITHSGNGSRCYAKHVNDPEWAIVHLEDEDVLGLNWTALALEGIERLPVWSALYGEGG